MLEIRARVSYLGWRLVSAAMKLATSSSRTKSGREPPARATSWKRCRTRCDVSPPPPLSGPEAAARVEIDAALEAAS